MMKEGCTIKLSGCSVIASDKKLIYIIKIIHKENVRESMMKSERTTNPSFQLKYGIVAKTFEF